MLVITIAVFEWSRRVGYVVCVQSDKKYSPSSGLFRIRVYNADKGTSAQLPVWQVPVFWGLWIADMLENVAFPTIGSFAPIVWFGGINAAVSIMSLIGIELFRRKVDVGSQAVIVRTLTVAASLSTMCMIVFGLVGDFWLAAVTYSLSYSLRIASSPLFKAWINQNVESSVRATVLSGLRWGDTSSSHSAAGTSGSPDDGAVRIGERDTTHWACSILIHVAEPSVEPNPVDS